MCPEEWMTVCDMKKAIELPQYRLKCRHNQKLCRLIIVLYHSAFKFNPFL